MTLSTHIPSDLSAPDFLVYLQLGQVCHDLYGRQDDVAPATRKVPAQPLSDRLPAGYAVVISTVVKQMKDDVEERSRWQLRRDPHYRPSYHREWLGSGRAESLKLLCRDLAAAVARREDHYLIALAREIGQAVRPQSSPYSEPEFLAHKRACLVVAEAMTGSITGKRAQTPGDLARRLDQLDFSAVAAGSLQRVLAQFRRPVASLARRR